MEKTYAQITYNQVDNEMGIVSLVGGEDVGLPLPEEFLKKASHIKNIDITELKLQPKEGWIYFEGKFYEVDPRHKPAPEPQVVVPLEITNKQIMNTINDLIADLQIGGII
ncbi:MAG: hypothetical protein ACRDA4_00190 [Filifactoraceae bacterium]